MIKMRLFEYVASDNAFLEERVNDWFARNPNIELISTKFLMPIPGDRSENALLLIFYKEPKSNNYIKESKNV